MQRILAVAARDLRITARQPGTYVVLALHAALVALFVLVLDDVFAANEATLARPVRWTGAVMALWTPWWSARALAEERRAGTDRLLRALPLSPWEVVLGKWLASLGIVAVAVALTLPFAVGIAAHGALAAVPAAGSLLGLLLLGGAFSAIGLACSAWVDSPTGAALLAFVLAAIPWVLGFFLPALPPSLAGPAAFLAGELHLEALSRGVLDSRSAVLFGALTLWMLQIAASAADVRRLRA